MKVQILLFLCCFFLVSCDSDKKSPATVDNNKQTKTKVWREYKRITAANEDTLPYSNCMVIIEDSKMTYKRNGKIFYIDSIYLDKDYAAKTFRFKNNSSDVMIITGKNDSELIIKRDAFDGDYEYFRKEK